MTVLPRICSKRMRVNINNETEPSNNMLTEIRLIKEEYKTCFCTQDIYQDEPIPVQQPLHYVKNMLVYSHSAHPVQMIRAHNLRFTKLPKACSSMQFSWIWWFQSVEILWVSWFRRTVNNDIRSLFWCLSLNLSAGHLNKLLSLFIFYFLFRNRVYAQRIPSPF